VQHKLRYKAATSMVRDAESIPYPGIRDLVRQRITELCQGEFWSGAVWIADPGRTGGTPRAFLPGSLSS